MTTTESVVKTKEPSLWRLLFGIIDRPAATFTAVLARRSWVRWAAPLLIVSLALGVYIVVSLPYTMELAGRQLDRQLAQLPPDQAQAAREQAARFTGQTFILISSLAGGVIGLIIGVLVQAVVLYFLALVAGGELEFGPVFTMSAWTRLPAAIGALAQAGFVAFAGRGIEYAGLSALAGSGDILRDTQNPLVLALARIDLFWLWHLLLVVVGLSVVARFRRFKALLLSLIYAALALIVAMAPALLQTWVGGGAPGG